MIVSEIYNGSGLGNQLWNIVAPRCIAEHRGFRWGVEETLIIVLRAVVKFLRLD
tara:strand:+ start:837 stop:998 length:162 start_codon:yes stop_codon:yes gene_type:complete